MGKHCISLNDLPPQGVAVTLDEPSLWDGPLNEFHMECRVTEPLRAQLTLLPMQGGCLVRGTLTGAVVQRCDRCAEDAPTTIAHSIETFESLHGPEDLLSEDEEDETVDTDPSDHIRVEKGVPMLDLASLCWEEFMLALPLRPLCSVQCKGLCSQCGANLNAAPCGCAEEKGDPRLAVLRNLKVKTPGNTSGK